MMMVSHVEGWLMIYLQACLLCTLPSAVTRFLGERLQNFLSVLDVFVLTNYCYQYFYNLILRNVDDNYDN